MRPSLFQRWLWVWHVIYIGGLLVVLGLALGDTWGAWGWREAALVAIVAALIAAYTRLFIFELRWPYSNWLLALYFSGALGLLALATWLHPVFLYIVGMLFGQIFGILPPVLAVPGGAAVLGVILLASAGWQLPRDIGWGTVLLVAGQLGLMALLYLYVYHVFRTSQERAGLINELRAANEALERARAQATELAALRERERVARDLHDGLGHTLVALSLQLEAIQRLYPVDPARASAQVDDMKRLTRDSMGDLRRTLDGLRAPGLGDEPLPAAIDRLCAALAARGGLDVAWRADDAATGLPHPVAEALWRVAQEALFNVERHAGATAVRVALTVAPDAVELVVSDDGRGLPPDAETRPGHYGLRGMRERVEGLGGTLALETDGGGTRVHAHLPLIR
jgi:signal transduction histidine kinase